MGIIRRLARSNVVAIGLFCLTCFVGATAFRSQGPKAGVVVFFIGFVVIGIVWVVDVVFRANDQERKIKSADGLGQEIIFSERTDTPLEYLAVVSLSSPTDELLMLADSIFIRATRLLNYRVEDGVIGEVLTVYQPFINQYVARAAELVKKHRKLQEFLEKTNSEKLIRIIAELRERIEAGNASLQSTLDEKQRTLEELGAMRESQRQSFSMLDEIDSTLESMETLTISAETNNTSAKDVLNELQRTISSTSQAIKETLCNHG